MNETSAEALRSGLLPTTILSSPSDDAVGGEADDLALHFPAPAEPERVAVDHVLLLVEHLERHLGRLGGAVALDVGEQGVAAVAHGAAGVEHQGDRIGEASPPRGLIGEDGGGVGRLAELGRGVVGGGAALRGGRGVAHGGGHLVGARHEPQHLLEEDALVGALGLLEGGDAHHLLAGQVHRRRALPLEREAHPVAGDEGVPFPLEREGAVLQREPDDGDDRVGGARGEGDGADERHRIAAGEAAEALVELRGVEEPGEGLGRLRLIVAADPFPTSAAEGGDHQGRHKNEPTHV